MKLNISIHKIQSNQFDKNTNKFYNSNLQNNENSNNPKKKSFKIDLYSNDYYDNFLQNLEKDKKNHRQSLKQSMQLTRRKKSKTLKITKYEANILKSSFNSVNKNKTKNLLRKSLLKKKYNHLNQMKTGKNDSSNISKKNKNFSYQIINNIQFSIDKKQNKQKLNISTFKNNKNQKEEDKEKENKSYNLSNENSILNNIEHIYLTSKQINPFDKIFDKYSNKYLERVKTYSYSIINDKKKEEVCNNYFGNKKIIPIHVDFISNAKKFDFSKINSMNLKEEKNYENKNENNEEKKQIDTKRNSEIISIYKINNNSNKKKKFLFCCCLPIKM